MTRTEPGSGGLDGLPPLREVIARHDLAARRRLGQHFLLDLNVTDRIARGAGDLSQATVIEVGPGPGGLTRSLLRAGAQTVYAVERDPRFLDALREIETVARGRLRIIQADALTVDAADLGEPPRLIVSNLPYNVATPLLIGWLRRSDAFRSLVLMFQKEVADRLLAGPGTSAYGRLSVVAQWRARVDPLFTLPPRAFTPPPAVESTVVRLTPLGTPPEVPFSLVERVTAAAFGQRRKMLRSSLKPLGGPDALLEAAGLDPTIRAEQVPVAGFLALAKALEGRSAGSG